MVLGVPPDPLNKYVFFVESVYFVHFVFNVHKKIFMLHKKTTNLVITKPSHKNLHQPLQYVQKNQTKSMRLS